MAVHESDREDLMREATALRQRIEICIDNDEENVIAGFRDDGKFSIYFGPDPVYHFNHTGQLRRSYVGGLLFRTQGNTLARLTRQRDDQGSRLLRHDLSDEELCLFLNAMERRLNDFAQYLQSDSVRVVQQVPDQPSLVPKLLNALQGIFSTTERLAAPIKGRKK